MFQQPNTQATGSNATDEVKNTQAKTEMKVDATQNYQRTKPTEPTFMNTNQATLPPPPPPKQGVDDNQYEVIPDLKAGDLKPPPRTDEQYHALALGTKPEGYATLPITDPNILNPPPPPSSS